MNTLLALLFAPDVLPLATAGIASLVTWFVNRDGSRVPADLRPLVSEFVRRLLERRKAQQKQQMEALMIEALPPIESVEAKK